MNVPARRSRTSRGLALISLAFAAAMLVPGLASAGSSNFQVSTVSQYTNSDCGIDHPELQHLAQVDITKKGPWLTVRTMFDGTPAQVNHEYDVYAYSATCVQLGLIGAVTTDGFGSADVTLPKFKLPGGTTSLFVTINDGNGWSDTPIVP